MFLTRWFEEFWYFFDQPNMVACTLHSNEGHFIWLHALILHLFKEFNRSLPMTKLRKQESIAFQETTSFLMALKIVNASKFHWSPTLFKRTFPTPVLDSYPHSIMQLWILLPWPNAPKMPQVLRQYIHLNSFALTLATQVLLGITHDAHI